jgi:RNA polymerase sigma-70 factor (ECF subfamily)
MSPSPSDVGEPRDIIAQHEEYLRKKALRLAGTKDAANDLVQDTIERALVNFNTFEQGTNARAWLVTILTRRFLDLMKHERVVITAEPELQILEVLERGPDLRCVPDAQLWQAIEMLPPEARDIIVLHHFKGMKYKDIAKQLTIPIGTVGTRLQRAREQLKALLTGPGDL